VTVEVVVVDGTVIVVSYDSVVKVRVAEPANAPVPVIAGGLS
jgi:hypothetical protein